MKRVVVMGLGITGRAVADALRKRDVDVTALDDRITDDLASWASARGVEVFAPAERSFGELLQGADHVQPAPGLADDHPIFAAAAEAGVPIMSELDLATMWDDRPVVAVTGTDGKTTVVTLIERMLERSGIVAAAVGNTDLPYVSAIDDPGYQVFVVEASSFRLGHSQTFSPRVATWLNFGPDHLDAHRDLATYEAAKASIWSRLDACAVAIANRDDSTVIGHAQQLTEVTVETFGAGSDVTPADHGVVDGTLVVGGHPIVAVAELARKLPHDVLNGLAAAASALRVGAHSDQIAEVLRAFDGLPHRVELIAEIDGVRYINDSKATTPHAAAAAIGGFDSIVLLAGGKNKDLDFDLLVDQVDHLVHVVALGEAASDVQAAFGDRVPSTQARSMQEAVEIASRVARSGDVVLLSPACASFDWYGSYRERGQDFANIVRDRSGGGPR